MNENAHRKCFLASSGTGLLTCQEVGILWGDQASPTRHAANVWKPSRGMKRKVFGAKQILVLLGGAAETILKPLSTLLLAERRCWWAISCGFYYVLFSKHLKRKYKGAVFFVIILECAILHDFARSRPQALRWTRTWAASWSTSKIASGGGSLHLVVELTRSRGNKHVSKVSQSDALWIVQENWDGQVCHQFRSFATISRQTEIIFCIWHSCFLCHMW